MSSAVPLTQAVTSGDAKAVSAALRNGADVNERNNGGQTALILAVIFGHTDLVRLLVKAGANPRLRDNLGLDALEWAQRRGLAIDLFEIRVEEPPKQPPVDTDEKSRKWLEGVKQRIQEKARQEIPPPPAAPVAVVEPPPKPEPKREPKPEPKPEPAPVVAAPIPAPSPTRKRCPRCNAIYDSELVAYCAHHVVPLVDADAPLFEPPPTVTCTIMNTPLLWTLILVTVSVAAFTTYMISSQLSRVTIPDTSAGAQQQPQGFLKGTPVAGGELAGKALTLAQAQCPLFEDDPKSKRNAAPQTVNVHLKVDKTGKVFWARAEGGDEALRNAATEAASQSTFSADKLRGRETAGTISYTFTP